MNLKWIALTVLVLVLAMFWRRRQAQRKAPALGPDSASAKAVPVAACGDSPKDPQPASE